MSRQTIVGNTKLLDGTRITVMTPAWFLNGSNPPVQINTRDVENKFNPKRHPKFGVKKNRFINSAKSHKPYSKKDRRRKKKHTKKKNA